MRLIVQCVVLALLVNALHRVRHVLVDLPPHQFLIFNQFSVLIHSMEVIAESFRHAVSPGVIQQAIPYAFVHQEQIEFFEIIFMFVNYL